MAQDKVDDIFQYYSQNSESARHQNQQLEFLMMEKILQAYLSKKQCRILEIGAGSGYYTQRLAQMGHEVVAVEPVKALIEENKQSCTKLGFQDRVTWVQSDARELGKKIKESKSFDVILNMGPLYHLIDQADRENLMKQSLEWLKDDGLNMSVFLSRSGYISYVMAHQPDSLLKDPEGFRDVVTQGFHGSHPRNGTFRGYFTTLNELSDLYAKTGWGLQTIHALDPCIGGSDEIFNRLSDDQKAVWLEVLFSLSNDPSLWSSGRTWLALSIKGQP